MECNKEEAVRAKELAEKKMQTKDFIVARKIALKAQQLFPDLENISQILTICEVHCSADVKVNGEMDWYSILNVQPTADELSIKKQYRKLALVLHPDKNKFAGAEAAFKLIGEAQMTLLDRAKRHIYDIKRNANVKTIPPRQPVQQTRNSRANFSPVNFNQQQRQQSSFSADQTFWTICPFCNMRFQYYRSILNRSLRCQNCLKTFVAHDLSANAVPSGVTPGLQPTNSGIPKHQVPTPQTNNVNHQTQQGRAASSTGLHGNVSGMPGLNSEHRDGHVSRSTDAKVNLKGTSVNKVKFTGVHAAKSPNASAGQKRGRKVVLDSSDSDSCESEEDVPFAMKCESTSTARRSTRHRENVIYNDDGSDDDDDDFANPPSKRPRDDMTEALNDKKHGKQKKHILHGEGLSNGSKNIKEDARHGIEEGTSVKEKSGLATESGTSSDLENFSDEQHTVNYPDPEFFDFDKLRNATEFAVDQIWAIYDSVDGMPRFYARIRKIMDSNFGLRFTWLEYSPATEVEIEWSNAELPVACGNFWLGKSETSEDRLMFSHVVSWEKGKKNSYDIYPKAGEVWALYKNWHISWSSDAADSHRPYEYEVVEVISHFTEGSGVSVIPLVKIQGFVSLFIRAKDSSFMIPPNEMLKFSHNVPFHKLTGAEREGLLRGCLELDCASLPTNFAELFPSVSLGAFVDSANVTDDKKEPVSHRKEVDSRTSENVHPSKANVVDLETEQAGGCHYSEIQKPVHRLAHQSEIHSSSKHHENNDDVLEELSEKDAVEPDSLSQEPESPLTFELPETEFHNFDDEKKIENLEQGQIWALYSDIDHFPKYYGYVKKVNAERHKVQITWLESCYQQEEKRWSKENIPLSCGIFNISRETALFNTTDAFSHLVAAESISKNQYKILPRAHEIWAVYKNWRVGWSLSDIENCEFDVVEISEDTSSGIKVNILSKLDGYRAVFGREGDEIASCSMVIPANEYVRFSHRIPAFLLTNERGGKLLGCWELDTASVPEILLFSSSE